MTGQTVTHYRVAEKIGEGASSAIYRAVDLSLGREVVLKFVSPAGSDDVMRFLHEARTISSLTHPNICTVYEIGEHEGRFFLAMEMLDGEVLAKTIAKHPLTTHQLIDVATQIADALDAAHAQRIVHRDLKPANIFVTRSGRIKLLDFGVALLLPERSRMVASLWQTTSKSGTIPYMSPEQAQAADLDHRSDLFSLGTVLYEMATGGRPFDAVSPTETMSAIVNRAPFAPREINPRIPTALERVILRALEKKPELRYQTAADLKADLQCLKRDLEGTPAIELARPRSATRPSRMFTGRLAAAVPGALLLAGAGWLALAPRAIPDPAAPPLPPPAPAFRETSIPTIPAPEPSKKTADDTKATRPHPATSSAQFAIATQQTELKLYDQAVVTLGTIAHGGDRASAIDASFRIAAIQELQGNVAGAMGTYVEIATRFAGDGRAPEALYRLAQSTLKSKREGNERDALRTIETLLKKYTGSPWAPRALLLRADCEARQGRYQRDGELGGSTPAAVATYRLIAARYPSSDAAPIALQKLATLYVQTKRYTSAAETYEALAAWDADGRYDAWFAAAEIFDKRLKDPARARAAYARVPSSSPRYAEALKRRQP